MSSLQSAICVTIGFLLIFGETNFVEAPKIHKIRETCSPRKKVPMAVSMPYAHLQDEHVHLYALHVQTMHNPERDRGSFR